MRTGIILALLCMGMLAQAQHASIQKVKTHWNGSQQDTTYGYAQALLVDNVLYISGVPGRGADMGAQLKNAYAGIAAMLKAHGAGFEHVVKETLYATDIDAVAQYNAVRKSFYKGDYPAASWVQVTRLLMQEAMVEIEVIAHLPKK